VHSILRHNATFFPAFRRLGAHGAHTRGNSHQTEIGLLESPSPTSTRTPFAFTRRGPCVPSRSAQGRRMLFVRLVNRAFQAIWRSHHDGRKQARDSGHSPFRGPARGRSPRADLVIGSFQQTGSSTSRSFVVNWARVNHRAGFSFSLCVTLAPKPTLKSLPPIHMRCRMPASLRATATIAHNMLDRLAIRRPRARNPDHFLRRSRRLQAPTWKMRDSGGPSKMVQRDRPHLRRCSNYPDGFGAPYP
jgi:hypothetical protein